MRQRRRQKAEGRRLAAAAIALVALGTASIALADGGTLRLCEHRGDYQVSVFTSPAALRVGAIDVSVLVQDAETGQVRDDVPVTVRIASSDPPTMAFEREATGSAATNKLFWAAQFEVTRPGPWHAQILVGSQGEAPPLRFDFDVAPPLPPWLTLAPWLAWPFGVVGLFVVHQRLVFRRDPSPSDHGPGGEITGGPDRSPRFC